MGIHASPTCTMEYDGAVGYLIGEENAGMRYMFTMMNNARLSVGLEGLCLAERAYQAAVAYAQERTPGPGHRRAAPARRSPIIEHADVRRMLLHMQAPHRGDAGAGLHQRRSPSTSSKHDADEDARTRADETRRPAHADHQGAGAPTSAPS